jgi:HPt (histidine-containing phosphotransfer) domain-containing protein
MDGYVSKPIQPQELFEAIAKLTPAGVRRPEPVSFSAARTNSKPAPVEVLDRTEALDRVGGDAQLLGELAKVFLEATPTQIATLRAAVARRDAPAAQCAAHAVKGSAGTFGARIAFAAAARVEALARAGKLPEAEQACAALEAALDSLYPAMTALAAENG